MPANQPTKSRVRSEEYKARDALRSRLYHQANIERIKATKKVYREANRDRESARSKRYREANLEQLKAKEKAHREANKEKFKAKGKAYREANKEKLEVKRRDYYEANKEAQKANMRAWHAVNKGRRYGLTPDQYRDMVDQCEGRCPCCKTQFSQILATQPCVDHCHRTNQVRGIICNRCNLVLGHASDNSKILRACARYLEQVAHRDVSIEKEPECS